MCKSQQIDGYPSDKNEQIPIENCIFVMFAKENSSTISSNGKKSKDIALRKSDRKILRQKAQQQLFGNSSSSNTNDDALLDDCFLKGKLLSRTLLMPSNNKATLYLRSPNEPKNTQKASTSEVPTGEENALGVSCWPYCGAQQCVWIEVKQQQKGGDNIWELPSVALMAALTTSLSYFDNGSGDGDDSSSLPFVMAPPQVSRYLCRGADLMRAGVVRISPQAFQLNRRSRGGVVVAVMVLGNPQPLAVGILSPQIQSINDIGPGTKGIACQIVSCYGDDLWKNQLPSAASRKNSNTGYMNPHSGAYYDEGHYGNIGFIDGERVHPIVDTEAISSTSDVDEESDDAAAEAEGPSAAPEQQNSSKAVEGEEDSMSPPTESTETATDTQVIVANEQEIMFPSKQAMELQKEEDARIKDELSPDQLLHTSVCTALAKLQLNPDRKKILPMKVANFYSQHVLPNRPDGTTIQLKQTKYKKFGAYLSEQAEKGLLQVRPDKTNNDPFAIIVNYNPQHEDIRDLIKEKKAEVAASGQHYKSSSKTRLVLLDLFCLPHHFVSLLRLDPDVAKAANATSPERRNTGMLTLKEMRAILEDYIVQEDLLDVSNPSHVRLDGPLTDVLYKHKKHASSPAAIKESLSRKDLMKAWQDRQERAYALVELPGNNVIKLGRGKPPAVEIEVTMRQSKKFVTHVRGFEDFGVDAAELSKEIAQRFACSSSIEESNTNRAALRKGRVELVFSGNLVDELEAFLLNDPSLCSHGGAKGSPYHLPKNSIQVTLRKGVPARKRRQPKKRS